MSLEWTEWGGNGDRSVRSSSEGKDLMEHEKSKIIHGEGAMDLLFMFNNKDRLKGSIEGMNLQQGRWLGTAHGAPRREHSLPRKRMAYYDVKKCPLTKVPEGRTDVVEGARPNEMRLMPCESHHHEEKLGVANKIVNGRHLWDDGDSVCRLTGMWQSSKGCCDAVMLEVDERVCVEGAIGKEESRKTDAKILRRKQTVVKRIARMRPKHGSETPNQLKHGQTGQIFAIDENKCGYSVQHQMLEEDWARLHNLQTKIAPDGPQADAYLVYDNFRTIMRYNTSVLYSISVYDLTHKIHRGLLEEHKAAGPVCGYPYPLLEMSSPGFYHLGFVPSPYISFNCSDTFDS
eukprot:Gb_18090 [translate_table: standard]